MSSSKQMVLVLAGILLAATMGIYTILVMDAKKRRQGTAKDFAAYNKKFKFLHDNFFTRNSFKSVVDQVSRLSIYNFMEIRIISVKFYTKTLGISLALLIIGAFLTKDLMATCIIAVYALVMRNVLVFKRIEDVTYTLLKQFSASLSSIYECYTKTHDVAESIAQCSRGSYLTKPFDQIYAILTAVDGEAKLNEFYATSPFRLLRTLATASYLMNDEGDVKNEKDQYAYQEALLLIKNEVDDEIRKMLKQRTLFQSLEYLPLAPIFAIGPLQSFFMSTIPGTSIVYQGMLGYLSRILIVLSSFVAYYIITTINRDISIRSDDRLGFIDALLHRKWFKRIVDGIMPKKVKVTTAVQKKLHGALSSKDIKYVYASKLLCSMIGFIFTVVALLVMTASAKEFTYKNVRSLSFTGGTDLTAQEEQALFAFDSKYMALPEAPNEADLTDAIKPVLPKATEMDRLEQAQRVIKKYDAYNSIHYRWWYIVIAYLVAVGCWFIPEAQIQLRKYLVKAEAEEDVLQMQTLIAILMYTPLDTLDTLYWLERNSIVHKDALLYAYHEYPSDAEKALNRLKSKSAVPEFHQMCDKLISTISEVSLKDAFPDLISQREHTMKMRETIQMNAIQKKRRLASPISLTPLAILVLGHVIAPIGILGYQEFVNTISNIGF